MLPSSTTCRPFYDNLDVTGCKVQQMNWCCQLHLHVRVALSGCLCSPFESVVAQKKNGTRHDGRNTQNTGERVNGSRPHTHTHIHTHTITHKTHTLEQRSSEYRPWLTNYWPELGFGDSISGTQKTEWIIHTHTHTHTHTHKRQTHTCMRTRTHIYRYTHDRGDLRRMPALNLA